MKRKQAIILNSGGFDSVCMIHDLIDKYYYGSELLSVFFNYGQKNMELERECARKVAKKFSIKHIEVDLPPMPWCVDSPLLGGKSTNQYIPMRNLIFLSYATSIGEAHKADSLYMATLYGSTYNDTNTDFTEAFDKLLQGIDMELVTPFCLTSKDELFGIVRKHGITRDDFFSCNVPLDNKPCGTCPDCEAVEEVLHLATDVTPLDAWFSHGFKYSPEFEDLYWKSKVKELRLLINNDCQFDCKHCFYGFKDMCKSKMTKEQFKDVIKEASQFGIENIHFSGKEPFYNEDIFEYMDYIDKEMPNLTYDVVTNGVTIPKYIDKIKECKKLRGVYVSVDSLEDTTIRPTSKNIMSAIQVLLDNNIPLQVFIDTHKDNYMEVPNIIKALVAKGVYHFHVRHVLPIGHGKTLNNIVSIEEYNEMYKELKALDFEEDVLIELKVSKGFTIPLTQHKEYEDLELAQDLIEYTKTTFPYVEGTHIQFVTQFFCMKFLSQMTVTPDGYVLGCATDVAIKNYPSLASGNIQEESLMMCFVKGRVKQLNRIKNVCSLNTQLICHHSL